MKKTARKGKDVGRRTQDVGRGKSSSTSYVLHPTSSSASSLRRYFAEAERYFSLKFGSPLLLSPRDVAKAGEWFEKGIPIKAVKAGIDRRFERLDPAQRRKAVVLAFCENDILDAWENLKGRGAERGGAPAGGKAKRVPPAKLLERYRRRLKRARKESSEEWAKGIIAGLLARADELRKGGKIPKAAKLRDTFEKLTAREIETHVPEAAREATRTWAARELAPYRPRMEESAYEKALADRALLRLQSEAGIPEFPE